MPPKKVNIDVILAKREQARDNAKITVARSEDEMKKEASLSRMEIVTSIKQSAERYRLKLEELDEIIYDAMEDSEKLKVEVAICENFRDALELTIDNLDSRLLLLEKLLNRNEELNSDRPSNNHPFATKKRVKLPEIEVAKFEGETLNFKEFLDQFESAIGSDASLQTVDKLHYLKSLVKGDAFRVIGGLPLINENYDVALALLKERYGGVEKQKEAHLDKLINLPVASDKTSDLRNLFDLVELHLRSLIAMNVKEDELAALTVPLILSKLPYAFKFHLTEQNEGRQWTLQRLRELFQTALRVREACPNRNEQERERKFDRFIKGNSDSGHAASRTTSTLVAGTRVSTKICAYCKEDSHFSDECTTLTNAGSRKEYMSSNRLCFLCAKVGHSSKTCRSSRMCYYCRGRHHRSICMRKFGNQNANEISESSTLFVSSDKETSTVLVASIEQGIIPMAKVMIRKDEGQQRTASCHLALDTASQRSYISEDLFLTLKLKVQGYEVLKVATFGSETTKQIRSPVSTIQIRTLDGSFKKIRVNVVPTITAPVSTVSVDTKRFEFVRNLQLAEPLDERHEGLSLQILVGADYYYEFVRDKRIELEEGLFLLDSAVGWIVVGRHKTTKRVDESVLTTLLTTTVNKSVSVIDKRLETFWQLESIGIDNIKQQSDDDVAMQRFQETVQFKNDRYVVAWPWKDEIVDLPENFELAKGRMMSLKRRFEAEPGLRESYVEILNDQLKQNIIEEVTPSSPTSDRKHYFPHHCVKKTSSVSTKIRIVYDASAKKYKTDNSLNDCLLRGPNLMKDLAGLLIRFRLSPIAIVSDIEKAFLQLELQLSDRDSTRFLWIDKQDKLRIFRFCRVPFGVISSPFLLEATVDHHLKKTESRISEILRDNLYVDNVCVGVDSVEDAIKLYDQSKQIFKKASMNLRQWNSNSYEFLLNIPEDDRASESEVNVLGLSWDTMEDTLQIKRSTIEERSEWTKRSVLSAVCAIFDPLGIWSPVTINAKILIQTLWKSKIAWDERIPFEIQHQWQSIIADLNRINEIKTSRWIGYESSSKDNHLELHCFCDASALAYAAVIYLRIVSSKNMTSSLILAKTRVAPINSNSSDETMTIPRLELMAVVIGCRLLGFVEGQLQRTVERKVLWSDSMCVLGWIQSDKKKDKFVENRLREIRNSSSLEFRYVPTQENPADLPSRGVSTTVLIDNKFWWYGPNWLRMSDMNWPQKVILAERKTVTENEYESVLVTVKEDESFLEGLSERCSSLQKLFRVIVWLKRACLKFRKRDSSLDRISVQEMKNAKLLCLQLVQKEHFREELNLLTDKKSNCLIRQLNLELRENNLICSVGRLKYANLSEETKIPVILPKNCRFTELVIEEAHHRLQHAGTNHVLSEIRRQFWIPSGRQFVKTVLRKCLVCKRWEGGPFQPPPAPPLPEERLIKAPAFTCTGIDFLGPLMVHCKQNGDVKIWICIFTCAVIRAVHLEVVPSMSTEDFLEALRRFIARRGRPAVVISDNGKQFRLAKSTCLKIWQGLVSDQRIKSFLEKECIQWKFITPLAPWMGGFYERLVGLVKRCLRKAINGSSLSYRQLETIMIETEAILNTRPLCICSSDIKDADALTPAHFLQTNGRSMIPNIEIDLDRDFKNNKCSVESLLFHWKKGQKKLDEIWKRFVEEYVLNLRERSYRKQVRNGESMSPWIGQTVLIKANLPRGQWQIGVIERLISSRDNQIRSAVVRTSNNHLFQRSVMHLYPLETNEVVSTPRDLDQNFDTGKIEPNVKLGRQVRKAAQVAREKFKDLV